MKKRIFPVGWLVLFIGVAILLAGATFCYGAAPAGYSEYFIPGDEANMEYIFNAMDLTMTATPKQAMHAVITVTAWTENTTIYYDHWEYSYEFDPANPDAMLTTATPAGHVEKYVLANTGDQQVFESTSIPTNPRGTATYYDGGDRIYVAGGSVTVTRASWIEATGVANQAVAWEIYPVKPQLTTYILPFGENLGGTTLPDFSRVFVLIQATADNTVVTVDRTGDSVADMLDLNRDGTCGNAGDASSITLNRGQTLLLDKVSNCGTLNTGVVITGTDTLQVKFVTGQERTPTGWMARGFSAFPRGFWTKDYYAPLDSELVNTDYYLYNPNTSAITVTWETMSTNGSFTIPAGETVSYRASVGAVPAGSGIYFKGSDVFWGVGSGDAGNYYYEWGFSLLPSTMMYNEHYLGWAPDCDPVAAACTTNGVFLVPAQDNTRVFVDFDNNGTVDQTYTLNRLQTQYITAPSGDLSMAHIWATGPFSMAYGQKGNATYPQVPAMDLGYVSLPAGDFVSFVITVDKSVTPQVVPTASGSAATFTIKVNSQKYTVDSVDVTDYLPPNWEYLTGTDTSTITWPDKTTHTTDPAVSGLPATGQTLTWTSADLGTNGTPGMAENQEVTITFTARTSSVLTVGTLSQNRVKAIGTRTFGTPSQTQTFTTTDFVYVASGDSQITKTSSATGPLYPGDPLTYTVTVTNPSSAPANQTGISIYDPLPVGVSYVAGSGSMSYVALQNVRDQFASSAYNLTSGSVNWSANPWTETDSYGTGPAGAGANALGGFVWATGTQLQFRYLLSTVRDQFASANYNLNTGSDNWSGNWTESATLDGAAGTVAAQQIYISGGTLWLDRSNSSTTFYIYRTASVSNGSNVTIQFAPVDQGIGTGEAFVAEWEVTGSGTWNVLDTFDGNNIPAGWSGSTRTYTINSFSGTSITLRFRGTGSWSSDNDEATIDNVLISYNSPANAVGTQVQRTANLSGATNATLTFDFNAPAGGVDVNDTLAVEVSTDGTNFTLLGTMNGTTAVGNKSYDLSSYTSTTTTIIRFNVTGGFATAGKAFNIDNVDISYYAPATLASGSPPNFLSSSSGMSLAPGNSLILTYNVTVDDPLVAGINEITNTAYANCNEIILPLSASVTDLVVNPSSGSASVGDRVWLDANGNGTLDVGEPGIANVEVTLKDQYGTPLMTTISDSTGHFLFTGVTPGNGYYVEATAGTIPSGLQQSAPGGHSDNKTNPFNLINLVSYGNSRDNFGAQAYTNSNGTVAWGGNWTENDTGGAAGGNILVVTAGTPAELRLTGGTAYYITRVLNIPAGATMATLSFDWRTTGVEANDAMDVQVSPDGVTYTTLETFSTIVGVASGHRDIDISSYLATGATIRFRPSAQYTDTANDYFFVDNVNVAYSAVSSVLGSYLDADLGYKPATGTAVIGNVLWSDANSDRVRNAGEAGLAGVTVTLVQDANSNGMIDGGEPVTTTTTAADGSYLFMGVIANGVLDYIVYVNETQSALSGYTRTTPTVSNWFSIQNIAANTSDLSANFGYHNASTYSIKDMVWYDANGDGMFDGGETGIALVTVELLDSSLNAVATTTTDAGGNFTFTGVKGGGADYTIRITDTNSKLADHYGTTASAIPGTKLISNLVADVDRTAGTGTVAVTNGSSSVVGTGTSFTNYLVAGDQVTIAGVAYIVLSVTDNTHLDLTTNYAGSTASGLAYSAPDFGYNVQRTIGSRVFNDANDNGVYNSGETGFSGVTVKLYNDCNGDGIINSTGCAGISTDSVVGTLVTDSAGGFLFAGVSDGNYIVSVESPPSGYTFTGTVGNGHADSDTTKTGQQQPAYISGGASVLNVDFGYKPPTPRSATGTIWNDINSNGTIDSGENGYDGVTIDLYLDNGNNVYDSGDTYVSYTTTASGGTYSFANLLSGVYFVKISDTSGMLSGLAGTYEKTGGTSGPFDALEQVDLSGGDQTGVSFGFKNPTPTVAVISSFAAYEESGRVIVEWSTASEIDTIGFYLYRLDASEGIFRMVSRDILPSLVTSPQGGTYSLIDQGASLQKPLTYLLVELEGKGTKRNYGPFTLAVGQGSVPNSQRNTQGLKNSGTELFPGFFRKAHSISDQKLARVQAMKTSVEKERALRTTRTGRMAKIAVEVEGLYYVDTAKISSLLGVPQSRVDRMISRNRLAISNQGSEVAYVPSSDGLGIYFYARGTDSIYTKENIYWLSEGPGLQMEQVAGTAPAPAGIETFVETIHIEKDRYAAITTTHDPESDYWFWDYVYAISGSPLQKKQFILTADSVADQSSAAALAVNLQGFTASDHQIIVRLNNNVLTTVPHTDQWSGTGPQTVEYAFDQQLLQEGDNIVEVEGVPSAGPVLSAFHADSFDLTYQKLYLAADNSLRLRGGQNNTVTAYGFTTPDVFVFDISDPYRPKLQTATTISGLPGDYGISFTPSSPEAQYLAVTADAGSPVNAWADRPSSLASNLNSADYVLITTEELEDAARSYAAYWSARGLNPKVVLVEDIMDEFNYGISSPEAIHNFLSYAYQNWAKPPRYVLLAGEGTYDYRNNLGFGDSLVPVKMVATPFGIAPSDNYFVDTDGDHIPEMSIGRVPVATPAELTYMLDKISSYAPGTMRKALFLADRLDIAAGDFPADSNEIARLVSPRFTVDTISLSDHPLSEARQLLFDGINSGARFLNYIGHGASDRFTTDGLFVSGDVNLLANTGGKLPVVTAWTCVTGNFSYPGYDSLSERLVTKEETGAIAFFGPTAMALNSDSRELGKMFYSAVFEDGVNIAGNAVIRALKKYYLRYGTSYLLDIYNLQGDPALRMK